MAKLLRGQNRTPLIAVALIVALLGFSGCQYLPGGRPAPSASQGVGKKGKSVPVAVQLKREIAKRKAAEAKVKELRRLLRKGKVRREVVVSRKAEGGNAFNFQSGSVANFFFGQATPSYPVIPPPQGAK